MTKIARFALQRVQYMPKVLQPGVLYVSEEFATAAHLCACGCGAKIRTPLGPTEWKFEETSSGPSLSPSVGSWQKACQSHYWIHRGGVSWAPKWTPEQIAAGRQSEEARRRAHYDAMYQPTGLWDRFWRWAVSLFQK